MRAVRQREFGGPEVLVVETVDDPAPGSDEVVIAVEAAGVHALDTTLRAGAAGPAGAATLPMTPGREVAGRVVALGADVDAAWSGARVVAHLGWRSGGYAERAVVAASALHRLPDRLDAASAVALIGTGRTAHAAIDAAALSRRDLVLVPGATGGLGSQIVQLAVDVGCTVVALVGGERKAEIARASLAHSVVDYAEEDWPDALRRVLGDRRADVLFDGVGGAVASTLFDALGTRGRTVVIGWSSGTPLTVDGAALASRGLTVTAAIGPAVLARPGYLRELETRALASGADGTVVPAVHRFTLDEAADAHRAIEQRRALGKVVLLP
ncbi:NADPH2:quinone reductase [Diaminobutyricimonas aerilata]|uniref:NADPH2:quinone reductase n=1 Tax=Diaminobutyricimonas aerilata TaxID=1162967 RepID=A0A2M9CGK9_9MICO|nr:zinc-binding dehydrogenase [Diaminobutyricimonas aerilata]PJJ71056.1 NADPH2:quinone reductase [Diaminobutyricimonas aerilata]